MTWIWTLMLFGLLANGLRLRRRARAMLALAASGEPIDPEHEFLVAQGVALDAATRRAASAHARQHGLQVLDLVPGDLGVERALYVIRLLDPGSYRADLLGPGRGAGQAILVARDVAQRAELGAQIADPECVSPADMARVTLQLKTFAVGRADVALAPGLRATPPEPPRGALAFWVHTFSDGLPFVSFVHWLENALLALGLVLAPWPGALALLVFQVQPWLIFQGSAFAPSDLALQLLARGALLTRSAWYLLQGWREQHSGDHPQRLRQEYTELLGRGTQRFFEARRPDCPFCGGRELRVRLRIPDRMQHKPGVFTLEECAACAHVFQNPRLTTDGLDFYYRDFYDGSGSSALELAFSAADREYRARAEIVRGRHTPENWLDVGTGHGHFCVRARELWPGVTFDGLDMSSSVQEAERRGWIRKGYRGMFPELAPKLEGSYDVVSMHHYLEHTREPLIELEAASLALRPGGFLVIEVPDPECAYGRWLGSHWVCWFQPQHQHFLPLRNLRLALERLGLRVHVEERGACHIPADLTFAVFSWIGAIAPPLQLPWGSPDSVAKQIRRGALLTLGAPFLALALVADRFASFGAATWGWPSNTYRVLAQKPS